MTFSGDFVLYVLFVGFVGGVMFEKYRRWIRANTK